MSGQLKELNEFSETKSNETAWTQLQRDSLPKHPSVVVLTADAADNSSKKRTFRVGVSDAAAVPVMYGYLTQATGTLGNASEIISRPGKFVAIEPTLQNQTAIYEFEGPSTPETLFGEDSSQFSLADAPLDQDGSTPKTVFWFYLKDFEKP